MAIHPMAYLKKTRDSEQSLRIRTFCLRGISNRLVSCLWCKMCSQDITTQSLWYPSDFFFFWSVSLAIAVKVFSVQLMHFLKSVSVCFTLFCIAGIPWEILSFFLPRIYSFCHVLAQSFWMLYFYLSKQQFLLPANNSEDTGIL